MVICRFKPCFRLTIRNVNEVIQEILGHSDVGFRLTIRNVNTQAEINIIDSGASFRLTIRNVNHRSL